MTNENGTGNNGTDSNRIGERNLQYNFAFGNDTFQFSSGSHFFLGLSAFFLSGYLSILLELTVQKFLKG